MSLRCGSLAVIRVCLGMPSSRQGLIAAYALSPIDLIPDFIPVLGYLDEVLLLPFAIMLVVKLIPSESHGRVQGRSVGS